MIPTPDRVRPRFGVNSCSRLLGAIGLVFTAFVPSAATADTVALSPFEGRADAERLEQIEQLAAEILREQGHRVVPPGAAEIDGTPTGAQMEAMAAGSDATYVVAAEVEPLRAQYRLHVHVYYRPAGRTEDLVATVLEAEERARISDILGAMVRRQGLGEDALRLTGEPADPSEVDAADAAEQARREEEERRRREEEEARQRAEDERLREEAAEAARQEAEEQARRDEAAQAEAQSAWDARLQYGADAPWMAQIVLGGRYASLLGGLPVMPVDGTPRAGGGLFDVGLRVGRTFDGLDGFELRGGVDFRTGAFTAVGLHVGAAWLGSFFVEPVYIGLGGEVGVLFTATGSQDVGFSGQLGALFAWRPTDRFYLEASLPELGVLTPGSGAVTIGGSLRGGLRF